MVLHIVASTSTLACCPMIYIPCAMLMSRTTSAQKLPCGHQALSA